MLENAEQDESVTAKSKSEPWSVKDGLIAIPFLASALALTWEVGFFIRIKGGAFGIFSISEHVTFALQALPVAFFAATIIIAGALQKDLMDRHLKPRFLSLSKPNRQRLVSGLSYFGIVFFASAAVYQLFYAVDAVLLVITVFALATHIAIVLSPNLIRRSTVLGFVSLVGAFAFTFAAGIDTARNEISSLRPLNKITVVEKGQDTKTELNVRIMRTGERGVLYFDPIARQFALLPWENIRRIDWSISPITMP
jgi:hypothetical protein